MHRTNRNVAALVALAAASLAPTASAQYLPIRELDSNGIVTNSGAVVVHRGESIGDGKGKDSNYGEGVRWDANGSHLLPQPSGQDYAVALDFAADHSVVGWSNRVGGYESVSTAVLWQNDVPTALITLITSKGPFGALTSASSIDRFGRICGTGKIGKYTGHAFLDESGVLTDLGSFGAGGSSVANRMNDHRQVVGYSQTATGYWHAFEWENGVMTDLHDPAQISGNSSEANDVDRTGRCCGQAEYVDPVTGVTTPSAVLFDHGVVTNLGASVAEETMAAGMNAFGEVVGWRVDPATGDDKAVLFQGGAVIDLDTLIDPALGWTLTRAWDVDDEGRIVGAGLHNGVGEAFIIEPPCAGFFASYGSGCAGSNGLVPTLSGAGCPTPAAPFALELIDAPVNAPAFVCIGTGQGILNVKPGCDLQVLPLIAVVPFTTDGFGDLWLESTLPSGTPAFDLYTQAFLIDPPAPLGLAASNPMQVHFQ
jgi:probable HAF family extracellular repeat protein